MYKHFILSLLVGDLTNLRNIPNSAKTVLPEPVGAAINLLLSEP